MSDVPAIIIPDVKLRRAPVEDRSEWLRRWEQDYAEGRETIQPPRNTRFLHNPFWRENWLSIQNAHDQKHWVWKGGKYLMYFAAFAWSGGAITVALRYDAAWTFALGGIPLAYTIFANLRAWFAGTAEKC